MVRRAFSCAQTHCQALPGKSHFISSNSHPPGGRHLTEEAHGIYAIPRTSPKTPRTGVRRVRNSPGQDGQILTKNADAAMYLAKTQGRNGFRFVAGSISRAMA